MATASKSGRDVKKGRKVSGGIVQEEVTRVQPSPRTIEMCESVAASLDRLGEFGQAGNWYEIAGKLILSEVGHAPTVRALRALPEYERALECYNRTSDDELITGCMSTIFDLKRACASA
jgi:hypothetical protein